MPNEEKIILDLCGGRLGNWSRPYKDAGYDVRVVDILLGISVRDFDVPTNVYGVLAAPPCTQFSLARMNAKEMRDFEKGMEVVTDCLHVIWASQIVPVSNTAKYTRLKFWALENPYNGLLKNFLGKPTFVFSPWEFGDDYKKQTALWGNFNFPQKTVSEMPDGMIKFDHMASKDIHPEHSELPRVERRSITPAGFAKAFYEANT